MKTLSAQLNEALDIKKYAQAVVLVLLNAETYNFQVKNHKVLTTTSDFDGNGSGTISVKATHYEKKITFSLSYAVFTDGKSYTVQTETMGSSVTATKLKETYGDIPYTMFFNNTLPEQVRQTLLKSLGKF